MQAAPRLVGAAPCVPSRSEDPRSRRKQSARWHLEVPRPEKLQSTEVVGFEQQNQRHQVHIRHFPQSFELCQPTVPNTRHCCSCAVALLSPVQIPHCILWSCSLSNSPHLLPKILMAACSTSWINIEWLPTQLKGLFYSHERVGKEC